MMVMMTLLLFGESLLVVSAFKLVDFSTVTDSFRIVRVGHTQMNAHLQRRDRFSHKLTMMGGGNEAEESGKIPAPKSVPSSASVSDESVEPASVTPEESASTTSFSTSPVSPLQNAYEASIMQILPKLEVDNLINQRNAAVKENIDLKFRLNTILSEKSNSMIALSQKEREINQRDEVIEQRDAEIAELRGVNNDLKQRIQDLKQRIQDLEAENENLIMRIRALEGQINELNSKVNNMIAKDEFEKFLVAIQDLNSIYTLEKKFSKLSGLRFTRVSAFHYIKKKVDSQQLVSYKKDIVISRLKTGMTQGCKSLFVKKFGSTFLSELVAALSSVPDLSPPATASSLTPDEQSDAVDWWD